MADIQSIVTRMYSLQYDGTNVAAIIAMVNDRFQQPGMFTLGTEDAGTATLISHNSALDNVVMNVGDHMIIPDALACTDEQFAYRYTVLA